jgi:hypothetical protein
MTMPIQISQTKNMVLKGRGIAQHVVPLLLVLIWYGTSFVFSVASKTILISEAPASAAMFLCLASALLLCHILVVWSFSWHQDLGVRDNKLLVERHPARIGHQQQLYSCPLLYSIENADTERCATVPCHSFILYIDLGSP